jgi:glycosyltransferase involved in cell wall biosynthesis
MSTGTGVVLDVQGAQDPMGAGRGIGRYVRELALALVELPSRHLRHVVVNADEPLPGSLRPLLEARPAVTQDALDEYWNAYHVGSLFDVEKPLDRVVPPRARRPDRHLVITLYDLIPLLFPDDYLFDPVSKARYTARLQLLRQAACVLAISESTAADAVERAGVDPARVHAVGAGVSSQFRPAADLQAVRAQTRTAYPRAGESFVLVTGAGDRRKNHRTLFAAYARLPDELRRSHSLVVAGGLATDELGSLERLAARLRIADRVIFTGFVDDDTLLLLYQACTLLVFPSLYEGFGLPAVEALAAGAPVLVSDSSSLREIVTDPAARFDPTSAASIRDRLEQALSSPDRRSRLRDPDAVARWSWTAVAQRVEAAYATVVERPRARLRRPRVALVSPLPPQRSRAAALSARLLARRPDGVRVDAYRSGSSGPDPAHRAIESRPARSFAHCERLLGPYDAVVYCLDGRPYSAEALQLLEDRPGLVLGLDLRLATLREWLLRNRPEPETPTLVELCETQYGAPAASELGRVAEPTVEDLDRIGILMSRQAIERSTATLVQSRWARDLALLEAPLVADRVEQVPWAVPQPVPPRLGKNDPALVTAFGWVDASRQPHKLVAALPAILREHHRARLAFVGPIDPRLRQQLRRRAGELGVGQALEITGAVDDRAYEAWLERTAVAVQLRGISNGESSSTVAECLSRGVPTITTRMGATAELPAGAVQLVDVDVTAEELANQISELVGATGRRAHLTEAGHAFARANGDDSFAELVWERALA